MHRPIRCARRLGGASTWEDTVLPGELAVGGLPAHGNTREEVRLLLNSTQRRLSAAAVRASFFSSRSCCNRRLAPRPETPGPTLQQLLQQRRIGLRRLQHCIQPHKRGMGGVRRRSDQDEIEQTRTDELAFLRKMRERASKSLGRVRSRSGTSSSPFPPRGSTADRPESPTDDGGRHP